MLDSSVHHVHEMLSEFLDNEVSESFSWLFRQQAWSRCEARASRDLDEEDAFVAEKLSSRSAPGKVAVIHSVDDLWVPSSQREMLLQTLTKGRAVGIEVLREWRPRFEGYSDCK